MKKLILYISFILILFPILLSANPIEPPPIITEIYFDEDENWTLEFYIDEEFYYGMVNLDSLRINTAILKQAVVVEMGVPLVITPDMIIGDLDITRLSGSLYVETYFNDWIGLDWGTYWYPSHPPFPGQSIAVQQYMDWYLEYEGYWVCNNYPPTLGFSVYTVLGTGNIHGYIFDLNGNPIPDVLFLTYEWLGPVGKVFSSNDSGYFNCDFISHQYNINYEISDPAYSSTLEDIWIDIDSTYYFEIIAPVYLTDIEEKQDVDFQITSYPNPGSNFVTFDLTILQSQKFVHGNIVICELSGKIIEKIPLNKNFFGKCKIKWIIPPSLQGIYIFSLELDNRHVASNKMIVSR